MGLDPWVKQAIQAIEADVRRSADTHLIKLPLPCAPQIHFYLKDESTHPTGSLKHRLARSLFLYGLCNGWIRRDTTIIETSSGSTAISEAYFARLLGLPFIAVVPASTSKEKIKQITFYGGTCHCVDDPADIYDQARALAAQCGGHYIDQFTYAERATDWRGNNNIAESMFEQLAYEPFATPRWVVVGAGTGGTSATIGRYIRYTCRDTQLCVVDPSGSVFFDYYHSGEPSPARRASSVIEGIGRPRVEPSFVREVIDRMIQVPDVASLAAIHFLAQVLGRRCGGSTGTNLYGAFQLVAEMLRQGQAGAVVTLICDSGERYLDTYYSPAWLDAHGYVIAPYVAQLHHCYTTGEWRQTGAGGPA